MIMLMIMVSGFILDWSAWIEDTKKFIQVFIHEVLVLQFMLL